MVLELGEIVSDFVCGQYLGYDGVAVLTNRRLVFANNRTFAPEVTSIALAGITAVKGWAESNRATLRVSGTTGVQVLGDIAEVDRAQAFATTLRSIG